MPAKGGFGPECLSLFGEMRGRVLVRERDKLHAHTLDQSHSKRSHHGVQRSVCAAWSATARELLVSANFSEEEATEKRYATFNAEQSTLKILNYTKIIKAPTLMLERGKQTPDVYFFVSFGIRNTKRSCH